MNRPAPYRPRIDAPEAEFNTLVSALRLYYDEVKRRHIGAVSRMDTSRAHFWAQERARCTRLIERVNHEYLSMKEEAQ